MASGLQQFVIAIQQTDYVALVILTAIGYDYILTFFDEVEYIWGKPWTLVSTLFFLTRYFGLVSAIAYSLVGGSFFPGSGQVYVPIGHFPQTDNDSERFIVLESCGGITILGKWTLWVFLAAADPVMILRVWALYNRSKLILASLLLLYTAQVVVFLVDAVMFSVQVSQAAVVHVFDFSLCLGPPFVSPLIEVAGIIQLTLGIFMCLLIVVRFFRELRETNRVGLNNYIKLLAREGMLYFVIMVLFILLSCLSWLNVPMDIWSVVPEYVPVITFIPRFTLSLRKLCASEHHGAHGNVVDTAFGFTRAGGGGAMVFAGAGQHEESDRDEEIEMEERGVHGDAR